MRNLEVVETLVQKLDSKYQNALQVNRAVTLRFNRDLAQLVRDPQDDECDGVDASISIKFGSRSLQMKR